MANPLPEYTFSPLWRLCYITLSVSFVPYWRHCSRAPTDLSRCPQLLCSSPSCLSSPLFCIDGARFPNDGIHQNSRMLPLCSSRIITEEGPVLLAVSMNCCFGKILRGDQGDFCHPQVTARWTVPSRVYHGCLFCLKFILHLWGLCFMSDPLVLPWDGAQHP